MAKSVDWIFLEEHLNRFCDAPSTDWAGHAPRDDLRSALGTGAKMSTWHKYVILVRIAANRTTTKLLGTRTSLGRSFGV